MSRFVFSEVPGQKLGELKHIDKIMARFTPAQALVAGFAGLIFWETVLLSLPIAARSGQPLRFSTLFYRHLVNCVTGLLAI